jgi:phage terminase large subunit-like protein
MLLEKAIEYAHDVIDEKEITTKYVKKQCQIFLNDLEKVDSAEFAYFFDYEAIEQIEGILALLYFATGIGTKNKTILEGLANFQAFFICNVFGFRFKDKPYKFKHRVITLYIARKNAKTFLCALSMIILLLTEENHSELYSICLDRSLAGLVKDAITQILDASPAIRPYFTIPKTLTGKIVCKLTKSFYQARTSEAGRNNGLRPAVYISDEIGNMKDRKNIDALHSGQLSVRNPISFQLTTAYAEDLSIMHDILSYIKKVFDGVVSDERQFALLYYAEEEANWWNDVGLMQSNPLRIEENYSEIRANRVKAIENPSQREEYLTKNMNVFLPTNSGEAYINVEDLRKCKIDNFSWAGRCVWVGIDLSMTTDNCAVSFVCEEDLVIYAESFCFIPQERIEEKTRFEKVNYKEAIKAGKCIPCGDMTVDYLVIEDFILELEAKYNVTIMGIGYDRYNCLATAQRLANATDSSGGGYKVVEVKQHSSILHPATKLLKEAILNQRFHYTENDLLEINFANAREITNNNMDSYINKKKSHGKVDMLASLINSVYLLQLDVIFNPDSDWALQII